MQHVPYWKPLKQVVIRREDIVKIYEYAKEHCRLRDYAMIRLAMRLGLRTGELASLQVEDLDFDSCVVRVLDSKKRRKFTLPCDPLTMEVLRQLCKGRKEGPVFLRGPQGRKSGRRNLSENEIWSLMRRIAAKAGVEDFKPRYFRYFFAAEWVKAGKNLEMLRRLLRHENIENTIRYVRRLVFFEDLQAEYLDFTRLPFMKTGDNGLCSRCVYADICKYAGRLPKFAKCERFKEKKRLISKILMERR